MKSLLLNLGALLVAGFIMAGGMRAGEWLIPKPETRVVFCVAYVDEAENVQGNATCKAVREWIDEARK